MAVNYQQGRRTWPVATRSCRKSVILAGHFQLTVASAADTDAVAQGTFYGIKRIYWDDSEDTIVIEFNDNWQKANHAQVQFGGAAIDFTSAKYPVFAAYKTESLNTPGTQPTMTYHVCKAEDATKVTHADMAITRDIFVFFDMSSTSTTN